MTLKLDGTSTTLSFLLTKPSGINGWSMSLITMRLLPKKRPTTEDDVTNQSPKFINVIKMVSLTVHFGVHGTLMIRINQDSTLYCRQYQPHGCTGKNGYRLG